MCVYACASERARARACVCVCEGQEREGEREGEREREREREFAFCAFTQRNDYFVTLYQLMIHSFVRLMPVRSFNAS